MSMFVTEPDYQRSTLAQLLIETIMALDIGDTITELYGASVGIPYLAGGEIQQDLQKVIRVLVENPHWDATLYVSAFRNRGLQNEEVSSASAGGQ